MKLQIKLSILSLMVLLSTKALSQNQSDCHCPETAMTDNKTDTVFQLSNGKRIVLCGFKNTRFEPVTYSEFVLAVCSQDSIIDFWGAVENCRFEVEKDSLKVKKLAWLPAGKEFSFGPEPWTVEYLYFKGNSLKRELRISPNLPSYNQAEINRVLMAYEAIDASPEKVEDNIAIAGQLLVATFSGSKKAREYFEEFPEQIEGLEGHLAEIYTHYQEMLTRWDSTKNK